MAGNAYQFPSDLLDSPEYGHMMQFTAYTPQFVIAGQGVGNRQILDTFLLYVPGGAQNNLVWAQQHEYEEVKMSRLGTGAVSGIMQATLGHGLPSKGAGVAGGIFRTTINPYVEVLYRGTDLRAFDFSFLFSPQSREDSQILYGNGNGTGMLNRFRYYAAPEISGPADLVFSSPSEWEIDFFYKTPSGGWAVNEKLPKIAKGILQRVDVDYNPDSEFSTFESGDSISSRLTMRFIEMEIIDKRRIGEGY
jgi:hypothetical protein